MGYYSQIEDQEQQRADEQDALLRDRVVDTLMGHGKTREEALALTRTTMGLYNEARTLQLF
jgi:hypothetical protein